MYFLGINLYSFFVLNRQAFENIYHMLRPNGTMLILFVASHEIFGILKDMTQDIRYAPYIKVNFKKFYYFYKLLFYFFKYYYLLLNIIDNFLLIIIICNMLL